MTSPKLRKAIDDALGIPQPDPWPSSSFLGAPGPMGFSKPVTGWQALGSSQFVLKNPQLMQPLQLEPLPKPSILTQNPIDWTEYGLPADFESAPPPLNIQDVPLDAKDYAVFQQVLGANPLLGTRGQNWWESIYHILNQVQSLDLDLYQVSVNRGLPLMRFSEYAPKANHEPKPNLVVPKDTRARIHGEVRPIQGKKESLITRFIVNYSPTIKHASGVEIEGFSAIDGPTMDFDRSFKGTQAVRSAEGGDFDYENPLETNDPLATPFHSIAAPPPDGHRDWMIGFNPVHNQHLPIAVGRGGMEFLDFVPQVAGGKGKLLLWAFLPTMGLTKPNGNYFEKFGIRYNTMPRRFGDLLEFFSPLFDSERGGILKHYAPYYNPNSEYISQWVETGSSLLPRKNGWNDTKYLSEQKKACTERHGRFKQGLCRLPLPKKYLEIVQTNERRAKACDEHISQGNPQRCEVPIGRTGIPEDPRKVIKINQERRIFGDHAIGRKRGTIIDWIFTDLLKDPSRLATMKNPPYGTVHFNMRPTTIDLPVGKVRVDASTDIRLQYFIRPLEVTDPQDSSKKITEAQVGLKLVIKPLKLFDPDFALDQVRLKGKELFIDELVIDMPSIPGWDGINPWTRPPYKIELNGVHAKGLSIKTLDGDLDLGAEEAHIGKIHFSFVHPPTLFGGQKQQQERKMRAQACSTFTQDGHPEMCRDPKWNMVITEMKGKGLKAALPQTMDFVADQFRIPKVKVHQSFKIQENKSSKCVSKKFSEAEGMKILQQDIENNHNGTPSADQQCRKGNYPRNGNGFLFKVAQIQSKYEMLPHRLGVSIPHLISKGNMDFVMKEKEGSSKQATQIHLEGSSHLRNIDIKSEFKGDRSIIDVKLDLSGSIDQAALQNRLFKKIVFTTKENGTKVRDITGNINLSIINPSQAPFGKTKEKASYTGKVTLDLPHVEFETDGVFKIPKGMAMLEEGHIEFEMEPETKGTLSGRLDLKRASFDWQDLMKHLEPTAQQEDGLIGIGPFGLGPKLSDITASGCFKIDFSDDGIHLVNPDHPNNPIQLGFKIDGSQFIHQPDLSNKTYQNQPFAKAIKTDIAMVSGKMQVEDLKELEIRRILFGDTVKTTVTNLDAGPLLAHHLRGSGSIWVDLMIWDYVRGFFPLLGGNFAGKTPSSRDPLPLTAHFPKEKREKLRGVLGGEDFFYLDKVKFNRTGDDWLVHNRELILSLHEQGGAEQFSLIRIPEVNTGIRGGKPYVDLGQGNFLLNIFLNRPERGGAFHWDTPHRWRAAKILEKRRP